MQDLETKFLPYRVKPVLVSLDGETDSEILRFFECQNIVVNEKRTRYSFGLVSKTVPSDFLDQDWIKNLFLLYVPEEKDKPRVWLHIYQVRPFGYKQKSRWIKCEPLNKNLTVSVSTGYIKHVPGLYFFLDGEPKVNILFKNHY